MRYLLIWDIDGTLIRTKGTGKNAMSAAFLELYGIENAFREINMAGMLDSVIMKKTYQAHNIANADVSKFYDRYCEILKDEIDKLQYSIACPGVKALLEKLENEGSFCNVLGTGNIERGARIKLLPDDLNRFFPTGGFGDEEIERWQVIEKAVANARNHFNRSFENSDIFIIGDTPRDIECGKKLNTKTVGVATGPHSTDELSSCGADFVFENLMDTRAFLEIFKPR